MPPVFGPPSPSSRRLWSCAGTRGSTVVPSVTANSDTSGPSRYSSTSTAPPASSTRRPWATAAARSSVTRTPLPAASPSSFTTYGAPTSSSTVSSSAGPPTGQARAVGTLAASMTCLAKDLLPSSCAASWDGPKQGMPASRTASAAPWTSGTSGPTTTRSAPHPVATDATATGSAASTASGSAIARVPALPGAQASAVTVGSEDRATHRACSRAPEPITSTRTARDATQPRSVLERPPFRDRAELARCGGKGGPSTVRLLAERAEEGAGAGPLLGPGAGVDPQQLAVRLRLQLAPGGEPRRVEPAVVDRRGDRAPGLAAVAAVAEPAGGGQLGDVGVGGLDPVGVVVERQLPHAGGVDEQPAAGQHVQLAGGGGVPAAPVLTDLVRPRDGAAGQCVGQAGLADPRGPDHGRRPSRTEQGRDRRQALAGDRADRQHVDAERVPADRLHGRLDVVAEVGLGEHDDRGGAAAPRDGEVALHPAQACVPRERVDDQHDVDVGGDDLGHRGPAGDRADEGAPPGQDLGRELPPQHDPVTDRRAARLGVVHGLGRHDPAFTLGGQHGEAAAVDAGHPGEDDAGWRFVTAVPPERGEIGHGAHGAPLVTAVSFQFPATRPLRFTVRPPDDGSVTDMRPTESLATRPTTRLPRPVVIGHRGAPAYRPEHTTASYELAIDLGAELIEPDVVISRDGVLVVRHESELSWSTDVSSRTEFADRRTTKEIDGTPSTGWFAEDFTLAELRTLRAVERMPEYRPMNAAYDGRFGILTLAEVVDLARTRSTAQRQIRVLAELKHPGWSAEQGLPMAELVAEELSRLGVTDEQGPVLLQSFDA